MIPMYGTNVFGANVIDCNCRCHHHQYQSNQAAAPSSIGEELDAIDKKWDEAYALFTKIYNGFVESAEFKEWVELHKQLMETKSYKEHLLDDVPITFSVFRYTPYWFKVVEGDKELYDRYSKLRMSLVETGPIRNKYDIKIALLKSYLGLGEHIFPLEWYHNEHMRPFL